MKRAFLVFFSILTASGLFSSSLLAEKIECESENYRYRHCAADTSGGVRLEDQKSRSPCILGETWGFDRNGIWVDEGCAGRFLVRPEGRSEAGESPGGWRNTGSPAELCRDWIREDLEEDFGRNSGVRFSGSDRRRAVSAGRVRVEGSGEIFDGRVNRDFSYECLVDDRDGQIRQGDYQLEEPQGRSPARTSSSEEARRRVQQAVQQAVSDDLGRRVRLSFETAESTRPNHDEIRIRGRAVIFESRGAGDWIIYSGTVDARGNRVEGVWWDYTESAARPD